MGEVLLILFLVSVTLMQLGILVIACCILCKNSPDVDREMLLPLRQ